MEPQLCTSCFAPVRISPVISFTPDTTPFRMFFAYPPILSMFCFIFSLDYLCLLFVHYFSRLFVHFPSFFLSFARCFLIPFAFPTFFHVFLPCFFLFLYIVFSPFRLPFSKCSSLVLLLMFFPLFVLYSTVLGGIDTVPSPICCTPPKPPGPRLDRPFCCVLILPIKAWVGNVWSLNQMSTEQPFTFCQRQQAKLPTSDE